MFLRETLAAAAGVRMSSHSIAALGEMGADRRHCDIHDDLRSLFDSLKPYRRFGDFQFLGTLSRPRPLEMHLEPYAFYGHFRAWLRKQGIDPEMIVFADCEAEQARSSQ